MSSQSPPLQREVPRTAEIYDNKLDELNVVFKQVDKHDHAEGGDLGQHSYQVHIIGCYLPSWAQEDPGFEPGKERSKKSHEEVERLRQNP